MEKTRILIVEDEFIIANEIKGMLEDLGYDVLNIAAQGKDAIQKAKENKPDLVLMDIMLKGEVDGIQAAEEIRSCFSVPIIYLTAYANKEILERAKVTTPFGYLLKPFKDRDLHIAIEMALYKHKVEREREKLLIEREKLANELKESLENIKILKGLLPVCAFCKKIRTNKGYWEQLEVYISKHSEAYFTHTYCPECIEEHFPEMGS